MPKQGQSPEKEIMSVLDRNLKSIWDADVATYRRTTAEDCSFFEWYISPQRIDGLDFHLRELRVHRMVVGGGPDPLEEDEQLFEHEILQPRVQIYGSCAIATFTLMVRAVFPGKIVRKSHNETRVFNNFGTEDEPDWKLVHCHKSPIATPESMSVLRS
ncbi:MAG: nuclear transport factor 2 family protein [Thermovirgaceae bacterium]|nr:nuclear transport factor 2 family protein [Thermovirgaceae bacterium]